MSPRSQSLQAAETRAQKAAFSAERLPSSRFGRVPAPALTSPKKAAHRRTVMNQRSMLSARPLLREPTTASGSFSAGASAWRSRCPAAGAPAPQGSSSSSIVAAPEQRSRYPSASQRSLGNSAPCPGLVPPEPAVPAGATSPGVALVRAEESNFGTRRPSQAAAARPPSRRRLRRSRGGNVASRQPRPLPKPEVDVVAQETRRLSQASASHLAEPTEALQAGAPWRSKLKLQLGTS